LDVETLAAGLRSVLPARDGSAVRNRRRGETMLTPLIPQQLLAARGRRRKAGRECIRALTRAHMDLGCTPYRIDIDKMDLAVRTDDALDDGRVGQAGPGSRRRHRAGPVRFRELSE
jgi:hypothetical protein